MGRRKIPIWYRFHKHFEIKPNGCWEWTGNLYQDGYGQVKVDGKQARANRVAYELYIGELDGPKDLVCHSCDNRKCVNPDHLFKGSHKDNQQDSLQKDRHARGERNGHAKLNNELVREVRRLYDLGYGPTKIHKVLEPPVGIGAVSKVCLGERWRHVQ